MEKLRYVAIEGAPGAGKTALAERLAARLDGRVLLDPLAENPFLPRFLDDPRKHAFQAQLSFLLSRFQQQQALWQQHLFTPLTVADYLPAKDRLYADLVLDPDELALYERVAQAVGSRFVKPDLVVFLQARPEVLAQRLRRRGGAWDRDVDPDLLEALARAWSDFFFRYDETPLLVVNANDVEVAASDEEVDALVSVIRRHRAGTGHYVPLGTRV
jgi:deoxyadenosine/deoxycytidine kinase